LIELGAVPLGRCRSCRRQRRTPLSAKKKKKRSDNSPPAFCGLGMFARAILLTIFIKRGVHWSVGGIILPQLSR
jgi:hypothetical protein